MGAGSLVVACLLVTSASCSFTLQSNPADAGVEPDVAPDAPVPPSWRSVAAGNAHTCAIKRDDSLWCWGDNESGQVGTGRRSENVVLPVQVGTAQWSSVAAGLAHTCGIQMNGSLWCWGNNSHGELGSDPTGTVTVASDPVQVAGVWTAVAAGYYHTCAIANDQSLACWGPNYNGELGTGDPLLASRVPVALMGTWTAVTAGYYGTCGIQTGGLLWCWGYNAYGVLGDNTNVDKHIPVAVGAGTETWSDVSLTYIHTCGVLTDGRIRCWGYNGNGQHGDGTQTAHYAPAPLVTDDAVWADVATGSLHTCARRTDGTAWCWGNDAHGETTISPTQSGINPMPTQVAASAGSFATLAVGFDHSCGITSDGRLLCTGKDGLGQLGTGLGGSVVTPLQIPGVWDLVSTQRETTCAHNKSTELWCWGQNENGQFGDGSYTMRQAPVLASTAARISIGVGRNHVCDVRANNEVFCTGYNGEGSLGDNTTTSRPTYAQVPSLAARAIVSWRTTTCALPSGTANGIWCWGNNTYGQLGTGDKATRLTPTQALPGARIRNVDTGRYHTCAVRNNGTLTCVGDNSYGELGIGVAAEALVFTDVSSPVTTWNDVATGLYHTCALTTPGALYCWGSNSNGQFGNGTTVSSNTPLPIGTDNWKAISIGYYHSCGIKTTGALACWGSNGRGQLGLGTFTDQLAPVELAGTDWASVVAGEQYTCATKNDNSLWCWGLNVGGQIGNGRAWRAVWDAVIP